MLIQNHTIIKCLVLLLCLFGFLFSASAAVLSAGTKAPAFKVSSGDGQQISLDSIQDKIVLLFYENKDVVEKNRQLKNALAAFVASQPLENKKKLLALPVIDCSGAFFPFTGVWKQQLVQAAKREGLTIYGDWDGKVKSAYKAVDKDSNFFLIDQSGIIRYSLSGQADSKAINTILNITNQLLAATCITKASRSICANFKPSG